MRLPQTLRVGHNHNHNNNNNYNYNYNYNCRPYKHPAIYIVSWLSHAPLYSL